MILKVLGIIDLISAILFWIFATFHVLPSNLILIIGFYLLIKGTFFLINGGVANVIDIVISLLIFLSIGFTLPWFVVFLITVYLIQKAILSLL